MNELELISVEDIDLVLETLVFSFPDMEVGVSWESSSVLGKLGTGKFKAILNHFQTVGLISELEVDKRGFTCKLEALSHTIITGGGLTRIDELSKMNLLKLKADLAFIEKQLPKDILDKITTLIDISLRFTSVFLGKP